MKKHIGLLTFLLLILFACQKEELPQGSAFYYPNGFTPNNDGINDFWIPVGGIGVNGDKFYLQIFTKNDLLIFTTESLNNPWYGKYKDAYMPSGYYFFVVTYEMLDGKKYRDTGMIKMMQ